MDQYQYLGNFTPTPPLTQHSCTNAAPPPLVNATVLKLMENCLCEQSKSQM